MFRIGVIKNFRSAGMTFIMHPMTIVIGSLKNGFLFFRVETLCTKPVRGLSGFIGVFVCIYKNTRSNFFKNVLTLYLRPFLKLRYFLYQIIFLCQQKRMLLLHQECVMLHCTEYFQNFGNSLIRQP